MQRVPETIVAKVDTFLKFAYNSVKFWLLGDCMQRKKILLAFGAILLVFFLIGCLGCNINFNINMGGDETIKGNGDVIEQERQAEGFDRIVLTCVGNVNVHPAQNFRVVVTTDSNIQEFVLVEVNNRILTLSLRSGFSYNTTQLRFNVYLPELKSVKTEGVGNITISAGNAYNLKIYLTGVGNIDSRNYQVQNVTITHSGVGNARVWATNSLNGTLSGVGNIRYRGNPTNNVRRTGIGNIRPLQ